MSENEAYGDTAYDDQAAPDAARLAVARLGEVARLAQESVDRAGSVGAVLFDNFDGTGLGAGFDAAFEVVAAPGEAIDRPLQAGDLVVTRALAEGGLAEVAVLADDAGTMLPLDSFSPDFVERRRRRRRRLHMRRPLRRNRIVLRARPGRRLRRRRHKIAKARAKARARRWARRRLPEAVLHSCRAGEGPPAALPDPEGRGLHPLVYRGTSLRRSRNPTVGDAQTLLNNFLAKLGTGFSECTAPHRDKTAAMQQSDIRRWQAVLAAKGQLPLTMDCRFGPSTELAAKLFQTCKGLKDDGKIGPNTWAALEPYRAGITPPVPPPPKPAPPIVPGPPALPGDDIVLEAIKIFREVLELVRTIPGASGFCTGMRPPTAVRFLSATEQATARGVYGGSLDFSRILVGDGVGCRSAAFTIAVDFSGVTFVIMNMRALTGFTNALLIHELAHAWQ